ncbi:hypothetical protein [Candidatus Absconditicoccus praedator]|uniref:hypothetical protein n=1 Tax=Candidatus Absconditicoccus praedator TaxID=2735562 RepID=UPI001E34469C|nr:hypothetical protein [Candidatus Absconditicoccus praedator]UFX83152.1 hypothetical protein HLG78_03395 [Candidatus Absconditicoccus praedator]
METEQYDLPVSNYPCENMLVFDSARNSSSTKNLPSSLKVEESKLRVLQVLCETCPYRESGCSILDE